MPSARGPSRANNVHAKNRRNNDEKKLAVSLRLVECSATEANAAEAEETSAGEEVTEEMKRKAAEAAWGVAEPPAQADAADAVDEASAEAPAEVKPMPAELSAEDGEKKTEA